MTKYDIKQCIQNAFIEKMLIIWKIVIRFSGLLNSMVDASNFITYIPLNDQQCITQPTLIDLNPNKYINGLCHYLLASNLDRCTGNCNTLNDIG